jgi:hypothetical protein
VVGRPNELQPNRRRDPFLTPRPALSQIAGSTTRCVRAQPRAGRRGLSPAYESVRPSGAGRRAEGLRPERESTLPTRMNSETVAALAALGTRSSGESESSASWVSCSKSRAAPCEGSRVGLSLGEEPLDAQDLQQPLEQHHLPREVFFFGLAFAGGFVPAAAARAFCFFVANLSLLGSLGPVRPMLLPVRAFERAESASSTRQPGSCWPLLVNAGLARRSRENTLAQARPIRPRRPIRA